MKISLLLLNALTLRLCLSFIICELKTLSYTGGSGVSFLVVALSVFVSIICIFRQYRSPASEAAHA